MPLLKRLVADTITLLDGEPGRVGGCYNAQPVPAPVPAPSEILVPT